MVNSSDSAAPLLVSFSFDGKWLLAKSLVSSLTRTLFSGSQMVFRNGGHPMFRIGRQHVDEVMVKLAILEKTEKAMREANRIFLFRLASHLNVGERQWIIVADAASVPLRNIDHL